MKLNFTQKGKGKITFLFVHGNSSSSNSFSNQLSSDLSNDYIMHAVDLPGHGKSPKADHINDYSMPGYANLLLKHIAENGLENVILVGWSLGGHIALEMIAKSAQFKGVIIFGTPPLGIPPAMDKAYLPNEAVNIGFTPEVDEDMALAYAAAFFRKKSTIDLTPYSEDILNTDGAARANLVPSMTTIGYEDEVKIVNSLSIPIMIIHGKQEQLVNSDYIASLSIPNLWKEEIQYIEGAGHAPQIETPEKFNSLLELFAKSLI